VIRRRLVVHGLVQGVWYRETTRRAAERHGVAGWIRNRSDGTVEAVLEGPEEAVERIVAVCRRGPSRARVESVEVRDEPPEGLVGFQLR
jgi:acylphosphatase